MQKLTEGGSLWGGFLNSSKLQMVAKGQNKGTPRACAVQLLRVLSRTTAALFTPYLDQQACKWVPIAGEVGDKRGQVRDR